MKAIMYPVTYNTRKGDISCMQINKGTSTA